MKSISFLIPAYNDEKTILTQVKEAKKIGEKLNIPFEIIVINDASPDKTEKLLNSLKKQITQLQVITHKKNKGYGDTIKELYYLAKNDWLFTIPGDYQVKASELLKLLPYEKTADIILGWRTNRHDSGSRQRQSYVYNTLIQLLFRTHTHDVNTVRFMKTRIMKSVTLHATSAFTDAELIIRAQKANFRIKEVPIGHRQRHDGGTGGGGKLQVILPTIWEMILLKLGFL